MALFEPRILSRPYKVHFAGFESSTYRLQQAGWQIAVEQDFYGERINLALHHPVLKLSMLAKLQDFYFAGQPNQWVDPQSVGRPLEFHITHCSSNLGVQVLANSFDFKPIDARPQFVNTEYKNIEDYGIFATPLVRTEEILIEPSSVAECLDLIRRLQAPDLADIRQRNRAANDAPIARQTFHAQILSLAA